MRILYVARHGQLNSQDDEGAITHALRVLGHSVHIASETHPPPPSHTPFDMMLCHRIDATNRWLSWSKGKHPIACWYFDQVSPPGVTAMTPRRMWADAMRGLVDFLFVTDGDYVATAADLHCFPLLLRQGADERWWGEDAPASGPDLTGKVLMTASVTRTSPQRTVQAAQLREKLGDRFVHYKRGLYGDAFRQAVSTADVVVAPAWPSTDRYWSNRVYVTLAAGGLVMHPFCLDMTDDFADGNHVLFYAPSELPAVLQYAAEDISPSMRLNIQRAGRQVVLENNLYRHRIEQLLKEVLG